MIDEKMRRTPSSSSGQRKMRDSRRSRTCSDSIEGSYGTCCLMRSTMKGDAAMWLNEATHVVDVPLHVDEETGLTTTKRTRILEKI